MTGSEISPVPREARPYQGHSAGLVTRIVANTIDALVVGVIVGAIYLGLVAFNFLLDPRSFVWPSGNLLVSLTTTLFIATGYLALGWWLLGRSYGDHVMGLRVVDRRGRRLGPLRALLRAGFCVFFPIGLFWCIVAQNGGRSRTSCCGPGWSTTGSPDRARASARPCWGRRPWPWGQPPRASLASPSPSMAPTPRPAAATVGRTSRSHPTPQSVEVERMSKDTAPLAARTGELASQQPEPEADPAHVVSPPGAH